MGAFIVSVIAGTIAGLLVWWLTNVIVRRLRRWVRGAQ